MISLWNLKQTNKTKQKETHRVSCQRGGGQGLGKIGEGD